MLSVLFLVFAAFATSPALPQGWQIVKDSRGVCQIAVPPDWEKLPESPGAAASRDATGSIAVVTSQPSQAFAPLSENMQRLMGIRKDKLFENSAERIFYQDRISQRPGDPNSYIVSVPGKTGTCSGRVAVDPNISEETAKKIALSLAPG